ncbi:hypothetical protein FACS1894205_6700 [Alphaproteobacteria bacterium]|nr:hypothetical protein FACS1894205_6700 [Alphaproteobacteria bacterium]
MWDAVVTFVIVLIAFFVSLVTVTALTTNILFWYEAVNRRCPETQTPEPGIIVCARMYFRSFFGYCLALCCCPLALLPFARAKKNSGSSRPPLALVHGIYHDSSAWIFHKPHLEEAGYTASILEYSPFEPLDAVLDQLDQGIRRIENDNPGRKPVLIGHSMGGLLIRAWLLESGNQARIAGVITLGTPHGGSTLAPFGFGGLVRNIAPKAELIVRLKNADQIRAFPCASLFSSTDEMVLPSENLLPPDGWRRRLIHNVNHYGLLLNDAVRRALLQELQEIETSRTALETTSPV